MSSLKDRIAARIAAQTSPVPALVPAHIQARYADELARIPQVRIAVRRVVPDSCLPAVGSFWG